MSHGVERNSGTRDTRSLDWSFCRRWAIRDTMFGMPERWERTPIPQPNLKIHRVGSSQLTKSQSLHRYPWLSRYLDVSLRLCFTEQGTLHHDVCSSDSNWQWQEPSGTSCIRQYPNARMMYKHETDSRVCCASWAVGFERGKAYGGGAYLIYHLLNGLMAGVELIWKLPRGSPNLEAKFSKKLKYPRVTGCYLYGIGEFKSWLGQLRAQVRGFVPRRRYLVSKEVNAVLLGSAVQILPSSRVLLEPKLWPQCKCRLCNPYGIHYINRRWVLKELMMKSRGDHNHVMNINTTSQERSYSIDPYNSIVILSIHFAIHHVVLVIIPVQSTYWRTMW